MKKRKIYPLSLEDEKEFIREVILKNNSHCEESDADII